MRPSLPMAVLLGAFLAGGAVRAWAVFTKPVLYHDEAHSYQAATGHVGEAARVTYDHEPPYGKWVEAREWKRLLRPERRFCFVTISRDALAYDVHPPLYYWLLHLACLTFGSHLWTGVLLNALLDGLTLVALQRFARYVTGDELAAATAAFAWALSAAAVQVAVVEARQYSLLALIAVLFVDRLARFGGAPGRPKWTETAALFALAALGALTHHHFAIVIAGALGAAVVARVISGWRRLAGAAAVIGAAYALIVVVHPVFYGTGFKHLSDTKWPGGAGLAARGRQALEALAQLVLERRFGSALPLGVVAVVACVVPTLLVLAWWRAGRPHAGEVDLDRTRAARYALGVGAWLFAVTIALYLLGVTPAHAMSHRYLATAWPFVGIAIGVIAAAGRPRAGEQSDEVRTPRGAYLTCAVAVLVGAQASWLQWRKLEWHERAGEADRLVRTADRVIIDNVGRGHWPRPVWRLREDAKVIVATPNDLLRRPAPWRAGIGPGTVYVSPSRSAEGPRERILQSLRREHEVEAVGHVFGIGEVFVVRT